MVTGPVLPWLRASVGLVQAIFLSLLFFLLSVSSGVCPMSPAGGRRNRQQQQQQGDDLKAPPPENPEAELTEIPEDIEDTVVLNVGGTRHEILRSTLRRLPDTRLADISATCRHHYRKSRDEYFFDRHSGAFAAILNLYRTGELHVPGDTCGPLFKAELHFWGVDEQRIEQCCWIRYNADNDQKHSLVTFEAYTHVTETDGLCCQCPLWLRWRARVWRVLDDPFSSVPAKIYAVISSFLILLSILVLVLETHPISHEPLSKEHLEQYLADHPDKEHILANYHPHNTSYADKYNSERILAMPTKPAFRIVDWSCTLFFTLEWLTRLLFSPRKALFFRHVLNVLDLLAVLPFYVELIVHAVREQERYEHSLLDKLFLLYILRIFRVFRLVKHFKGFQVLAYTLRASVREILFLLFCLTILMLIFGSLIYVAEFGLTDTFDSIPHAFWWAIVTMTTVGYGDMTPATNWGYLVGAMCAVSGVLVVAFTVPTMVNNFLLFYNSIQYQKKKTTQAHAHGEAGVVRSVGVNGQTAEGKVEGGVSSPADPGRHTMFTPDGSPKIAWEEDT